MSNHMKPQEKISARRTYTLLQQAFFKLLTEKPFEKITLKELCDTAMIPRSTFYRYFEDKYDLLGYCLQNFFENMDLDIDVIYLKNLDSMKDYLAKTLKVLDTAHAQFSRIYRLNRDGVFMDLLRSLLIQVLTDKLKQAENSGIHCRISTPVFTYLLADFYISVAKCYLDFDGEFSAENFIEHVVLFANRNFFE